MNPKFILSKQILKEQVQKLTDLGLKVSYSYKTNREVGNLLQELFPGKQGDEIAAQNTRTEGSLNNLQAKRPTSEATYKRSDLQAKRPIPQKTFLNKVEEFLEKQNTKIISIEEVDKKKVIARIQNSQQAMLFAFNKKRITELELMKCYKKAKESNLPYHIITQSDQTKKMNDTIDAYKKLIRLDKLNT